MACAPVVIPDILTVIGDSGETGGWCTSQSSLTTFVDLININFQILIDCFETAFNEELILPGVPPVTFFMPGVHLPGVDPIKGEFTGRTGLTGKSYTGNRFPWTVGGEARVPWEWKGFPVLNVPSQSFTVPGVDPMRIVMKSVQTNYEIIVKAYEDRGISVPIDWSAFLSGCNELPSAVSAINGINGFIPTVTPDSQVDGDPLPGSEIPTFGPGSGTVGSCWGLSGDVTVSPGGDEIILTSFAGATGTVTLACNCSFEATEDGEVRAGLTATQAGGGGGGIYFPRAQTNVQVWSDSGCTTLEDSCTASVGTALFCSDTTPTEACGSCAVAVLAGQRVTMTTTLEWLSHCVSASFSIQEPWMTFSPTSAADLC